MTAVIGENEIISSRELDFPRKRVFEAWTNPDQLARWWGPNGFTNTFHEFDLRPGGAWRYIMHGPDGVDYPNHCVFEDIVPLERIVFRHLSGHEFLVTATFEELGGRTKVVFRQLFMKTVEFEEAKKYCVKGNEQNLNRLEALLADEWHS
ncbi:SRPBCC family protein [Paenibacillus sp. TH7-28]